MMYVGIETCQGGFLIEVRLDVADPTFLVMQGHRDCKKVCTSYAEVEKTLRELFIGKIHEATVEHHGT